MFRTFRQLLLVLIAFAFLGGTTVTVVVTVSPPNSDGHHFLHVLY